MMKFVCLIALLLGVTFGAAPKGRNTPQDHVRVIKSASCDCSPAETCVKSPNGFLYWNECTARCLQAPAQPNGLYKPCLVKLPKKPLVCACPNFVYGVCDKQKRWYKNPCTALCHGAIPTELKPCNKPNWMTQLPVPKKKFLKCLRKGCPNVDEPVCDLNKGLRWKNKCVAKCAGAKNYMPCPPAHCIEPGCPNIQADVCDPKTGKRWKNSCIAKCEGARRFRRCPPVTCLLKKCPTKNQFVCDASGKKYRNSCDAHCRLADHLRPCNVNGCKHCQGTSYSPICDVHNGHMYHNSCIARCHGATHLARCEVLHRPAKGKSHFQKGPKDHIIINKGNIYERKAHCYRVCARRRQMCGNGQTCVSRWIACGRHCRNIGHLPDVPRDAIPMEETTTLKANAYMKKLHKKSRG